ncbi:MAG: hypothetical protein JWL58_6199, partial [Streptosporangiaceae bacterium]|nr:hypothetical protein [Streptosporangiaceae bacterium]
DRGWGRFVMPGLSRAELRTQGYPQPVGSLLTSRLNAYVLCVTEVNRVQAWRDIGRGWHG